MPAWAVVLHVDQRRGVSEDALSVRGVEAFVLICRVAELLVFVKEATLEGRAIEEAGPLPFGLVGQLPNVVHNHL